MIDLLEFYIYITGDKKLFKYIKYGIIYTVFVSTAKYKKCTILVNVIDNLMILPKEKETNYETEELNFSYFHYYYYVFIGGM